MDSSGTDFPMTTSIAQIENSKHTEIERDGLCLTNEIIVHTVLKLHIRHILKCFQKLLRKPPLPINSNIKYIIILL